MGFEGKTLLASIFGRDDGDDKVGVVLAAGVDYVLSRVSGFGVPGKADPLGVFVNVAALHDDAQLLARRESGSGGPDLDLHRHRYAALDNHPLFEAAAISVAGVFARFGRQAFPEDY